MFLTHWQLTHVDMKSCLSLTKFVILCEETNILKYEWILIWGIILKSAFILCVWKWFVFYLFSICRRISNKGHPNIIMIFCVNVIIMKFHGNREKHFCLSCCCGRVCAKAGNWLLQLTFFLCAHKRSSTDWMILIMTLF